MTPDRLTELEFELRKERLLRGLLQQAVSARSLRGVEEVLVAIRSVRRGRAGCWSSRTTLSSPGC